MAVERMYERLKAGQTIRVQVPETGRRFSIRPEYWHNLVLGYSVVELDGRVTRDHKGMMLSQADVEDWARHLNEQVQP